MHFVRNEDSQYVIKIDSSSMVDDVIQAIGKIELEDGKWIGDQLNT